MTSPHPPASADPPRRLAGLNPFRGLVCLSIVLYHVCSAFSDTVIDETTKQRLGAWRPGVESFFVLSGYFLALMFRPTPGGYFSVPGFLRRRMLRLIGPFWVAVLLAIVWHEGALVRARSAGQDVPPPNWPSYTAEFLLVNDVFGYPNTALTHWSLTALFQFYVTWAAVFWIIRRAFRACNPLDAHRRTLLVMVALSGAVFLASGTAVGLGMLPAAADAVYWRMPLWAVYLTAGCFVYWSATGFLRPAALLPVVGFLLALAAWTGQARPAWGASTAIVLLVLSKCEVREGVKVLRPLGAVGRWSYSIYLVHQLAIYYVFRAAGLVGAYDRRGGGLATALTALAASVACGYVFYRLVEVPFARLAERTAYHR